MKKPFVIGISGSIGSGKSLIRHLLAMRGVLTVDADELTHFLLAKGKAGYVEALHHFGKQILTEDGKLDRGKLGRIVFNNPLELQKLEMVIHPLVNETLQAILQDVSCPLFAVEAIKLYDSDLIHSVDSRWFVTSTTDSQMARLEKTRGMTRQEVLERLNQQSFPKNMSVDHFIENNSLIADTWERVGVIWQEMVQHVPGFQKAAQSLAQAIPISILDFPGLKQIDADTRSQIQPALQNDVEFSFEENVLQSQSFITPVRGTKAFFVWEFNHFNILVNGIPQNGDEKNILEELQKLEILAQLWSANCVVVKLKREQEFLKQGLISNGYQELSSLGLDTVPFLQLYPSNEGTTETRLIKPMTGGVWRLIP